LIIGLNNVWFRPGKMGGVETYFRNLVRALERADSPHQFVLLANREHSDAVRAASPRFSVRAVFPRPGSPALALRGIVQQLTGVDPLRKRFDSLGLSVIHHPYTIVDPSRLRCASVLTFWDMQHEFFPEFFTPMERFVRRRTYRASALEATRIIVAAEFTRRCLCDRYGIASDKIDVVHPGFGAEYRTFDASDDDRLRTFRQRHGLQRPFVYYPAVTWTHKNHVRLLRAVKLLRDRGEFDGDVVFSGAPGSAHRDVGAEIARLGLTTTVRMLGYLPYAELPIVYNAARLMVFPSLFEGFGIPVVEAMACGCPVACSNTTSLPELIADAGATFDPTSVDDLADAIRIAWNDETARARMRTAGLNRVRRFDWNTTAHQTLGVYERAVRS